MRDLYDSMDKAREKFPDMDNSVRQKEKEVVDMQIKLDNSNRIMSRVRRRMI